MNYYSANLDLQPQWTCFGPVETLAFSDVLYHLRVGEPRVGLVAKRHDLPQQHSIGPDVGLNGEPSLMESFGWQPPHRQLPLTHNLVVV